MGSIYNLKTFRKLKNLSDTEISEIENWYYKYRLWCKEKNREPEGVEVAKELGFEDNID